MKILKWVLGTIIVLCLVVGVGIAALVYLVDWNDFKETIQNETRKQTGRDLVIAGDLSPSVFPWAGISISDITLANAEGFGDEPFARIGSADVKVELLPLLRRVVNVRTVQLDGLALDLQRAADGTTNWDDLVGNQTTMTTTTEDEQTTTEVEGSSATIAALEVGGIDISDANVSWQDAQGGTDARLNGFNLETGAIALQEAFDLSTSFSVSSTSLDLDADVEGGGEVMIDLENQIYSLNGFTFDTKAKGGALPGEQLDAAVSADIMAMLGKQQVAVKSLTLDVLGIKLEGKVDVSDLDTQPQVTGTLVSEQFSPREVMQALAIAVPATADENVLKAARLDLAFNATPASAAISQLAMTLDDTTLSGTVDVPSLEGDVPPLRFALDVDKIDLDRYLPPATEGEEPAEDAPADDAPVAAGGDTPIELPEEMLRALDVDGTFRVGSMKASNLTVSDIVIPVKAADGKLGVQGMQAKLYEGNVDTTATLDVSGNTPAYALALALAGIQADPLLADLTQSDSFLSGKGEFKADITTGGKSVDALTAGLNGGFNTAFNDGSINGINIGYQLRRAKAALSGQKLSDDQQKVKTDFSSLSISGQFTNGVMNSDDLDMRSPLLRVGGAGKVDLPAEQVDYTVRTKVTGSAKGQGGDDLASLRGVALNIPVQGSFEELAADPSGVLLRGMRSGITGNLKGAAEAQAREAAAEAKAAAQEQLKAREGELKDKLNEEADKAREKLKGFLK